MGYFLRLLANNNRQIMNIFKRITLVFLIGSMALLGTPFAAQAGVVSGSQAFTLATDGSTRAKVNALLAREDVRSELTARGVSVEQAQERVNAMTNAEVTQLAGRIDELPAGGDVLGLLFTVFIVLLVTDILGLTKVFSFTRGIR